MAETDSENNFNIYEKEIFDKMEQERKAVMNLGEIDKTDDNDLIDQPDKQQKQSISDDEQQEPTLERYQKDGMTYIGGVPISDNVEDYLKDTTEEEDDNNIRVPH